MDSSRRAVESYWRSRMVDAVTSDEDKVAPVYKLEEICEILRVSDSSIVKEMSEFVLKRLDHKSPIVKQKALRMIKYSVAKSGNEFRREMQKHSTAVRGLVHYKGQPDPLKGDALNKAVRETANETMAAIFSTEESKPAPTSTEGLGKRIQGFGNTNYDPTMAMRDDKRSFLSDVVEMGSASIKQGISSFNAAHNMMKSENTNTGTNNTGTYRSPNLRRSLTSEKNNDGYIEPNWTGSSSKNTGSTKWGPDSGTGLSTSGTNDDTGAGLGTGKTGVKTREERLLETVVTTGGVRLQPTRDALQLFLIEMVKLDAVVMSCAVETKLQSPLWQVRMKAMCVLEAILRKKNEEPYSIIASYFSENIDSVAKCCDLPQVSLREKATKVLNMLDEQYRETRGASELSEAKTKSSPVVQLPDLIDTVDLLDDQFLSETPNPNNNNNNNNNNSPMDDLFGSVGPIADISTGPIAGISSDPIADLINTPNSKASNGADPFADVSFHVNEEKETKDLFSGLNVDDKLSSNKNEFPDIFADISPSNTDQNNSVNDLMAGLDISGNFAQGQLSGTVPAVPAQNGNGTGTLGLNMNSLYNQAPPPVQYNAIPPQFMMNPAILGQQMNMNYGAMSAFIAQQQQILQNMSGFNPQFGANNNVNNLNINNMGFGGMGGATPGGFGSPALPDIFQTSNTSNVVPSHVNIAGNSKKEDNTKAFDFVSDHLAAARGSKKLI